MKNVMEIEIRLEKLRTKPVENLKLIKKWERILRKAKGE